MLMATRETSILTLIKNGKSLSTELIHASLDCILYSIECILSLSIIQILDIKGTNREDV